MTQVATAEGAGVYVVLAEGTQWIVKIGVTTNVDQRLRSIQAHSPLPLRVEMWRPGATRQMEQQLHREFAASRSHGEWFHLDAQAMDDLRRAISVGLPRTRATSVQATTHRLHGNFTLGRCQLCSRNVQAKHKYIAVPPIAGSRRKRRGYRHVDCKSPYEARP